MAYYGAGPSKRIRFTDADFEATGLRWLDEIESGSDEDSVSESVFEPSEHDTDSEEDGDEATNLHQEQEDEFENSNEEDQASRIPKQFYGKNRFKWSSQSFISRSRTQKHNIVLRLPTLRGSAAQLGHAAQPSEVWNLLITDDMLTIILRCTNEKIQKQREKLNDSTRAEHQDLDIIELRAFIGLLFYSAVFVSNHENINKIFATDGTGREIFRCVMSKQRFAFLLACMRFDNYLDREFRKKEDPIAPISEIFGKFVEQCQALYSIGENCCIDEMLVAFRGRCKFKMFMPKKPCKYGIKIICMTDARTQYFFNGYIYAGKDSDGRGLEDALKKLSKPTQSVIRLVKPIEGTNRNITADNWFSSLELVEQLKNRGLTYVGTLKKNKKEVPAEFLPKRNRKVGREGTLFGFTKEMTLVSYIPKKNRAVILISSMHHSESFDPDTDKPEIITYYNFTKGGVDALDEKCAKHSTSRRTRRWPMVLFFRILDISGVNAHIIHQSYKNNTELQKTDFLKTLADELVRPHLERRASNPRILRELRFSIRRILNLPEEHPEPVGTERLEKRKTCYTCPSRLKRKTFHLCYMCTRPICVECSTKICSNCKCHL